MKLPTRKPAYYLVCAACLISLAAIEWNTDATLQTLFATGFYIIAALRYVYVAIMATLIGSNEDDLRGR